MRSAEPHARLEKLTGILGQNADHPFEQEGAVSKNVRLGGGDTGCITALGDDTAILTIVTDTRRAKSLLRTVAREYGIEPVLRGSHG